MTIGFRVLQCKMEVNRKNRTLMHFIPLLRKNIDRTSCLAIITSIRTLYKTRFFKRNGGENADNRKSSRCKKPYISRVFGICHPMSQADFESAPFSHLGTSPHFTTGTLYQPLGKKSRFFPRFFHHFHDLL